MPGFSPPRGDRHRRGQSSGGGVVPKRSQLSARFGGSRLTRIRITTVEPKYVYSDAVP
jgi:hypothetical protein